MVVKSFMRSWEDGDFEDIGFNQQYEIYKYISNNVDDNPPILDATKIRNNPKNYSSKKTYVVKSKEQIIKERKEKLVKSINKIIN